MSKAKKLLVSASVIDICVTVAVLVLAIVLIVVGNTMLDVGNQTVEDHGAVAIKASVRAFFGAIIIIIGAAMLIAFVYFLVSTIFTSIFVKQGVATIVKRRGFIIASAVMSYISTVLFIALAISGILTGTFVFVGVGLVLLIVQIVAGTLKVKCVKNARLEYEQECKKQQELEQQDVCLQIEFEDEMQDDASEAL